MADRNIQRYWDNAELYRQKPDFWESDVFYIHLHAQNIGKMANGDAKSDDELSNIFDAYKNGKDSTVQKAVTNQYLQAMKASIKKTTQNRKLLDEVFDIKNNNASAMLDQMHKTMQEGLEKYINTENLVKLLQNEKTLKWNEKGTSSLTQAFKNNGEYQDSLKFLDTLLQAMADTVKLINSPLGPKLAEALLLESNSTSNFTNIKDYGANLTKVLNKFEVENKAVLLNTPLIQEAIKNLDDILSPLTNLYLEKNKNGKVIREKTTVGKLQGRVTNNFFPNLAEILAAQIEKTAVSEAVKITKNARRTGAETSQIQITDTEGNYSNKGYFDDGGKKQDKADNIYENVQMSIDNLRNGESGYFKIDIGISSKSYVTQHFGTDTSLADFNDVYSLGGGMTIGNAFRLLLGDINADVYKKYLGYNVFARDSSDFPKALNSLQDVLLTRSIVYIASGRNKKNIAQFMMINGNFLSIWDIIKYTFDHDIGKSSSQLRTIQPEDRPGLYMTISNREKIIKLAKSRFWLRRIVKTNEAIDSATMKVHIIPKQIINGVVSSGQINDIKHS